MKEYKRLTKRDNEFGIIALCPSCSRKAICDKQEECVDCITEEQERLAELEDKIENGTLIELPCKVGGTVYYETFKQSGSVGIKPHKVIGFVLDVITQNIDGFGCTAVPIRDFGESAFLTKAEAEVKLKELQEEL